MTGEPDSFDRSTTIFNSVIEPIPGTLKERASESTLGRKSLGTLLRHALCQGLQEKAKMYSLDRIGDITSEQIIAGIAEVRNSLELSYVCNERSELEPKISSELLKYFPKFARVVYGPEPLPMS